MVTTQAPGVALLSVPDPVWAEAARREAVLRPLLEASRLSRHEVAAAALALELSAPRVYSLLRVFRSNPVTASLLPRKPGQAKGASRLGAAAEERIEAAITAVYMGSPHRLLKTAR